MFSAYLASAPATKDTLPDDGDSESSASNKNKPRKRKQNARIRKYNLFNIFFMLERQLLLQARGGGINAIKYPVDTTNSPLARHKELQLPPFCQRYKDLPLTSNWFAELIQHHKKKRKHTKSHGLLPFRELAKTVAKHYREIDPDTHAFLKEVTKRLGRHLDESDAIDAKDEKEAILRREISGGTTGAVRGCQKTNGLSQDEAAKALQLMGVKTLTTSSSSPRTVHNHLTSSSYHVSQDIYLPEGRPYSGTSDDSEHERSHIERSCVAGRPSFAEKKAAHPPKAVNQQQQHSVGGDWKNLDSGHLQNEMPCSATHPSAHPPATDADARGHPASTVNSSAHSNMNKVDPELERLTNELKGEITARYDLDRRIILLQAKLMARLQILPLKRQIAVADVRVRSPQVTVAAQQKPQDQATLEIRAQAMQQHRQPFSAATVSPKASPPPAPSQASPTPGHYHDAANALAYPDAKPESEHPVSTLNLEMTRPAGVAERTLIDEAMSQTAVIDADSCCTLLETLLASVGGGAGGGSTLASLLDSFEQRAGFQAQDHGDKGTPIEKRRRFTSKKSDVRTNSCDEEEDDQEEVELEQPACRDSEDIPDVAISAAANASIDNLSVAAVTAHPLSSSDHELGFCKGTYAKFLAAAAAAQLKSLPPRTPPQTTAGMPAASETRD